MDMASPRGIKGTPERLAQLIAGQVVNLVVESLDFDMLLDRINVNALLQRIDVNELLEQINFDDLLSHVDVNVLMSGIDLNALMKNVELETIIARSTSSALGGALDLVRRQGVGLDDFVGRFIDRVIRRKPGTRPLGPVLLVGESSQPNGNLSST
jgi:hypothetical protein